MMVLLRSFIPSLGALLLAAGHADAQGLLIDKSEIRFVSKQLGVNVEGRFRKWRANIVFLPKNLAKSKAEFDIDLGSIDRHIDRALSGGAVERHHTGRPAKTPSLQRQAEMADREGRCGVQGIDPVVFLAERGTGDPRQKRANGKTGPHTLSSLSTRDAQELRIPFCGCRIDGHCRPCRLAWFGTMPQAAAPS